MTVQTTYNKLTDQAILGLIYDMNPKDIASFAAEAIVGFGRVVGRGTGATQAVQGAGSGVLGLSIKTSKENTYHDAAFNAQYEIGETVGVMRMGALWCHYVEADATPAVGDPVYFTAAGQVTSIATGNTLLANATFESIKKAYTNISGVSVAIVRITGA